MTTTVKERNTANWQQAKQNSKQRAKRIRKVFQAAAAESFSELKAGSVEFQDFARTSLAEWLATERGTDQAEHTPVETTADGDIPSWNALMAQFFAYLQDRKDGWWQQFVAHWNEQSSKFDADMTQDYGDRYMKVKSFLQHLNTWLTSKKKSTSQEENQEGKPVKIEVLDGEEMNAKGYSNSQIG